MKKSILLILFLMFAGIANAAVDTQFFGFSPNIIVNLIKQDPDPIEPGKQVEISLKIDNNGTTTQNFVFEILPEYPFSLLPGESSSVYIGDLSSSQEGKHSVVVKFKLRVDLDAVDGKYDIKFRYKNGEFDSWVTLENLEIKIQSNDAILAVDKVTTTPAVTAPGDKTKLRIDLKNYASSLLKNVKISLNLDKTSDDPRPFAPIGSTNEKVISYIDPQSILPIEFELLVDSDAASKTYKIPLNLKYSDALNNNYSKSNIVAIVVGDKPDLGITLERTDVYTSDTTGSVVLRLVNKGNPDIKFLNVKVLPTENVKVIGADEVYVGKLDSDDFSTAEFKLNVKGKGSVKIPVELNYKDTNNNSYKESREVELKLYTSREAKNFGVKQSSNFWWTVFIVLVLIAGYYYYRKRKKKK